MRLRCRSVIYIIVIMQLISGCTPKTTLQATIYDADNKNIVNLHHQDNDGYKLFYGNWEYVEVVSQHQRIGADENYNNLMGKKVTYHPEYFENNSGKINAPTYLVSIYPLNQNNYNQFFPEQIGLEVLLPSAEYFIIVQVVNKPDNLKLELNGFTIIVGDNNTLYAFDNNCIYKLKRVGYIEGYDSNSEPQYQERW